MLSALILVCGLLLAQSAFSSSNVLLFTSTIIHQYFTNCLVLTLPSSPQKLSLHTNNPTLSMSFNSSKIVQLHISKYSRDCRVIVTDVDESADSENFYTMFTRVAFSHGNEASKRDKDYYIFICLNSTPCDVKKVSKFAKNLRFKLIVQEMHGLNVRLAFINPFETDVNSVVVNSTTLSLLTVDSLFPDFTRNFHQHEIRISSPTKYVSTYEMQKVGGVYRNKRGFRTVLIETFLRTINATYSIQPCSGFGSIPEGSSGTLLPNGTWAGCMGDVIRGISDMALLVAPSAIRFGHVNFLSPPVYSTEVFAVRHPDPAYTWRVIYTALDTNVWLLVIVLLVLAVVIISITDMIGKSSEKPSNFKHNLITRGLSLLGSLAGQDLQEPGSQSGKFLFICWLLYSLIIGTAYSSSLQATIVSPGVSFAPKSYSELINSGFRWGTTKAFYFGVGGQLYKRSSNAALTKIYTNMEVSESTLACLKKVASSKFACMNFLSEHQFSLSTQVGRRSPRLQESTERILLLNVGDITRKYEVFSSQLSSFYSHAFDTGIVKEMRERDWQKYRTMRLKGNTTVWNYVGIQDGPKPLQFDAVFGCFIVLFVGLFFGFAAFTLEKLKTVSYIGKN